MSACRHCITDGVREPHHRVGVGHVEPARIIAARVEGHPVRFDEARREDGAVLRSSRGVRSTQDANAPRARLHHEDVAVGCYLDDTRLREPRGVELDGEAGRCLRKHPLGTGNDARDRGDRLRGVGSRKIFRGDPAKCPRLGPGGGHEGRSAGEHVRGLRASGGTASAARAPCDGDRHGQQECASQSIRSSRIGEAREECCARAGTSATSNWLRASEDAGNEHHHDQHDEYHEHPAQ